MDQKSILKKVQKKKPRFEWLLIFEENLWHEYFLQKNLNEY